MVSISQALSRRPVARPRTVPLEIPTQSNPGRYGTDGETRLINCYVETAGKEGKIPFPVYASDGLKSFSTLTNGGGCRGLLAAGAYLYAVSNRLLFAVDPSGAAVEVGGIADDGFVTMSVNRATNPQIVITTRGGLSYILTNVTSLSALNNVNLPPPNCNAFIDGYTLFGIPDGRVFYSAIDDSESIGANDFFTAEGSTDDLTRVFVHQRTIFIFKEKTTELWENVGDANNPFQRLPGGFLEFGCTAPNSIVSLGQYVAFVDDHGTVVLSNASGVTQRVSTFAVERDIDKVADRSTIGAMVYHRRGHEFYVLSAANFTWIWDKTTGQWHERQSYQKTRWRACQYAYFANKALVSDSEEGKIYELDPDTYDEAGSHLIATMRVPIHAWPRPISLNRLRVDMIPGVGLNSGSLHTSDPQLMFRLSKNGGKSWGNEQTRSIGLIGQYGAQTAFDKLGVSDEDGFVAEISVSAAVVRAFTGLSGEIEIKRRSGWIPNS